MSLFSGENGGFNSSGESSSNVLLQGENGGFNSSGESSSNVLLQGTSQRSFRRKGAVADKGTRELENAVKLMMESNKKQAEEDRAAAKEDLEALITAINQNTAKVIEAISKAREWFTAL
ncbi:uncharacterized protein LOC120346683 [Styela clava]